MSLLASKGFLVGATVAAFVVAGSAVAWYSATREGTFAFTTGDCGAVFGGRPLEAVREDTGVLGGDPRRVVTYELNASDLAGGDLRACSSVGDLEVSPSDDGRAHVVFTIESEKPGDRDLVRDAVVRATFVEEDGGLLLVAAHEAKREEQQKGHSVQVSVRISLPPSGPYAFHLTTGVGDVHLDGFLSRGVAAHTGVGDVGIFGMDMTGDVAASTGTGDMDVDLTSVESGTVAASSGVGDVHVFVPSRPDIGYDAHASTGVGAVHVEIGPTEDHQADKSNVGGDVRARSKGYADRPVKVEVSATTGVGDVGISS